MLKSAGRSKTDGDPLGLLAGPGRGADLWARHGEICLGRGELSDALRCFQRALEADVDCLHAWAGLAEVFVRMRDPQRAEACLVVARRIRAGDIHREAMA